MTSILERFVHFRSPSLTGVLGRDAGFDVRVMDHHPQPGHVACGEDVLRSLHPHVVADLKPAARIRCQADRR